MEDASLNQKQTDDSEVVVDQFKKTFVVAVARHRTPTKNYLTKISCNRGVPMGGYVYDSKQDSYFYPCVDFLLLGPVNAAAYFKSRSNNWSVRIPLAVPVLLQFVEGVQKTDLERFIDSFDPADHEIHYLQLIDPNESNPPVKSL